MQISVLLKFTVPMFWYGQVQIQIILIPTPLSTTKDSIKIHVQAYGG